MSRTAEYTNPLTMTLDALQVTYFFTYCQVADPEAKLSKCQLSRNASTCLYRTGSTLEHCSRHGIG